MKPEIKFLNFEPSLAVREHARSILDEIEQIGPSDATVRGALENTQNGQYASTIIISASTLRARIHEVARTPFGALDKAHAQVLDYIFEWQSSKKTMNGTRITFR